MHTQAPNKLVNSQTKDTRKVQGGKNQEVLECEIVLKRERRGLAKMQGYACRIPLPTWLSTLTPPELDDKGENNN